MLRRGHEPRHLMAPDGPHPVAEPGSSDAHLRRQGERTLTHHIPGGARGVMVERRTAYAFPLQQGLATRS